MLRYELDKELGYSQQYYKHRTAHIVEVNTDDGITGWGECFGPGNIALADKYRKYRLKDPDYIKIVKQAYMNDGKFWTKSTLGSGEILKYKDLVLARKQPDVEPPSPFDP